MTYSRWLGPCVALCVLAPVAPAQEKSPLGMVPAQAPLVFHLRGAERTKGRLVTMINNALPDLGKKVQESLEDGLKGELGERQLKGLAPFGPVFVAFTEMPQAAQDAPPLAFILRVTDAKAFRDGFFTEQERKTLRKDEAGYEVLKFKEGEAYLHQRDDFLVLALKKESIMPFLKPDKGLDGKLGPEAAQRLLATDAGVFVDVAAVYQVYGETVKGLRQFIDLGLQQAAGAADKDQIELMKKVIDGALQGFEDGRHLLLTLDFRPDGLALHTTVKFGGDSKTNSFLKQLTPGDLKAVDTLPAGQMTYMAVRAEPALTRAFAPFLLGVSGDPAGEQGKRMQKVLDLFEQAGSESMLQTSSLMAHGISVSRYKDPAKATAGQLELFQALTASGSYSSMQLKKASVKPDAQKHRGFTLHHAELVVDFEKMAEAQAAGGKELAEAMKKIVGDSIQVWFGTDGKLLAQVTAKDWAEAQKLLDSYLDGKVPVGNDKAFQETRKQLPTQTNVLMLYDVPQFMESMRFMFGVMFKALGQGEIKVEPPKEKSKPTYLGVAITLKDEFIGLDVWIPGSTAREVQKLIDPLIQAFGG